MTRDADALGKSGHGTPSPVLPTPGPWTFDEQAGWVVCGWFGVHKVPAFNDASRDTHLANARLIAAAPELLAALTALYQATPAARPEQDELWKANALARAAIAKATRP